MSVLQAALGLAQLEKIDSHILKKREIGQAYQAGLKNVNGFLLPLAKTDYAENIYWIFGLVAESQQLCEQTVRKLNEQQIGTRPFFWCMHEQPIFKSMGLFKDEKYPVAEKMARNGFYLPSGLGLEVQEIQEVINKLV